MDHVDRWDYTGPGLDDADVPDAPWPLIEDWTAQARQAGRERPDLHEPTSMAVATVDASGRPDVRVVLMRFLDPRGPGFVSSRHSAKAGHIAANPVMAASLTWTPLFRAIRFRGVPSEIESETLAAYWASRPWGSRISAWSSRQSQPVTSRAELETAYAKRAAMWPDRGGPDDVPVPDDWVGYRLECDEVEVWAGREDRLHDRFRFTRTGPGDLSTEGVWHRDRLQP